MKTLRAKLLEDYLSEGEMAAELGRDVRTLQLGARCAQGRPTPS
jgi:hypothetical protein